MHLICRGLFVALLLLMVGCTEVRVEGDAKIFQSSAVGFIIRIVLGVGLIGVGIASVVSSFWPDRKPRNRAEAMEGGLSSGQRVGLAIFGGAMGVMGLGLILISLTFASKLHVTVHPDRVEMASTFNQTGGKEVVVPFAKLSSVEIRLERGIVGKLKNYLVFTLKDQTTIRQEAGNNERQALETIQKALAEYQSKGPNPDGQPQVARNENAPSDEAPLDSAAAAALAPFAIPNTTPPAARAPKEYQLKRYEKSMPIPENYLVVGPDTNVKAAQKLKVCFVGKWSDVTVLVVNDDGTITCDLDGWKNHTYRMMREDLIIRDPEMRATVAAPVAPPAQGTAPASAATLVPPSQAAASQFSFKRYPIDIPVAPGTSLVTADANVKIGMKLGACYSKRWEPVTVLALNADGTITCRWDNWPGYVYKMLRSDLTISNTALSNTANSSQPQGPPASTSRAVGTSQPKYALKRYKINIPVPAGRSIVDADTQVNVGMKLGACYAGNWESVTVVAVNDDGTITCNWDKWTSFTYKMVRDDLTISK